MAPLVIASSTISLDGYTAGPNQSLERPMGVGGEKLHGWLRAGRADNTAEAAALLDHGAFIMGRNMFGPSRGEWDMDWRGWWGEEPPYHGPVFVLTHHGREPLAMDGGTTFHFVTEGIDAALQMARAAAGDRSISVAGGASTLRQFLAAGHVDQLNLQVAPAMLGAGERPLDGLGHLTLTQLSVRATPLVTHMSYRVEQ